MSDPKPAAWLCELAQDDGTTRTMIVQDDPAGLRFNDIGEPSPFKVTPLYAATAIERQAEEFDALAHLLAQRDVDIARLTAEREELRADAERWQFARDWLVQHGLLQALRCQPEAGMKLGNYWVLHSPSAINGDSCDGYGKTEEDAIDAARARAALKG